MSIIISRNFINSMVNCMSSFVMNISAIIMGVVIKYNFLNSFIIFLLLTFLYSSMYSFLFLNAR